MEFRNISDIIYVSNNRIGIKKSAPGYTFDISGTLYAKYISGASIQLSLLTDKLNSVYAQSGSTGADASSQVTLYSGLKSDATYLYHDGPTTNLYLYQVPQKVLKSGSNYWNAYQSAQIALYSETYSSEGDLTAVLNDNYPASSQVNKTLISNISSNIVTKIDNINEVTDWTWGTLSNGIGINTFSILKSGSGDTNLTVKGYAKISSNAKSGQSAKSLLDISGSKYHDAYIQRGSQIAGQNLTWNGTQLDAALEGADTSGQVTLTSGLKVDSTYLYHDGPATDLYLYQVPQKVLQSGAQYWQAYQSAQIALYSETYSSEGDLTSVLDDNYAPSGTHIKISGMEDVNISSPASGETLVFTGTQWENQLPAMTYSIANVRLSAQQNINLARFIAPAGKKVYIWQAYACNSGMTSVADLQIELLSGSTSVYTTSSNTLQQGNPLAVSDGGNIEIRLMYSGGNASGIQYATGMIQISVY